MDITNILNTKGAAAAAAAAAPNGDQHMQQQLAHSNGHNFADTNSERANSPHGSEHSSRYSGPGMGQVNGINGMNGMNGGMRYPSPTPMQNSLPMLQGYRADNGFDGSIMQQNMSRGAGGQSLEVNTTRKAFDCSVCGKDFARRSDLARHGKFSLVLNCFMS
jgi:hypothetical protein